MWSTLGLGNHRAGQQRIQAIFHAPRRRAIRVHWVVFKSALWRHLKNLRKKQLPSSHELIHFLDDSDRNFLDYEYRMYFITIQAVTIPVIKWKMASNCEARWTFWTTCNHRRNVEETRPRLSWKWTNGWKKYREELKVVTENRRLRDEKLGVRAVAEKNCDLKWFRQMSSG